MNPEPSPEALLEAYSRVSRLNQSLLDKLKRVLAAFQDQSIDVMLLKGTDLIFRVYGAKGLRPMDDADLLVREKDLSAIDRILKDLGYRMKPDGNPAYLDPENLFVLDLITGIWYLEDTEEIWRRSEAQNDFPEAACKVMSVEDLVLYLAAYTSVHRGYFNCNFARDLTLVLERELVHWPQVVERAKDANLKIPVHHAFSFAVKQGANIPASVIAALSPCTAEERRLAFLFRKLVTTEKIRGMGHFLLWLTRPRNRKGEWIKKVFFPDASKMQYRYGEKSKGEYFFLRIKRIGDLMIHALILSAKIFQALFRRSESLKSRTQSPDQSEG